MKKVSIVILNWNGKKLLEAFLPSIIQYTDNSIADIIVADNASTDDSIYFITNSYPQIKTIRLQENYGFAEGYNRALKQLETEYFILLNSDVEVTTNWLEPIIDYLDNNDNVSAIQPKILAQRNKEYFEYAGASGGFIDKYGYPFCRGRIFDIVEKDFDQYNTQIQIFWASGACLAIRAKDFFDVGGFDSSFFAHMEEIDLCWRLNARGKRIMCIPQSTVFHVGGATLNEESPRKTFLNFRNNLLMLYKNLSEKEFRKVMRIRTSLDYLAALQMLMKRKKENYKAILNAHSEFKKIKKEYTVTRDNNLKNTVNTPITTIYPKSLLFSFFFKGQKTFDSLYFKK
jgi:GT2 family glycosyltransferase